jgi:hypothetical protein
MVRAGAGAGRAGGKLLNGSEGSLEGECARELKQIDRDDSYRAYLALCRRVREALSILESM